MPLGTEVGVGPGGIVLDGDPAPPTERGTAAPHFSAHFVLTRSSISGDAELLRKLRHVYYVLLRASLFYQCFFILETSSK